MKRSLFWAAVEAAAKATRTGFGVVAALVDCGIPRQHAGEQWLTAFEEENECLEVPLSADFTDEAVQCSTCGHTENAHGDGSGKGCYFCGCLENPEPPVATQGAGQTKQFGPRPRISTVTPQNSRTNAGATCNRAVEEGLTEGARPPAAPFVSAAGVPTFKTLEDICAKYVHQHWLNIRDNRSPYVYCTCGIELGSESQWIEHVAELQASALSFAIQEARNTKEQA